MSSLTDRYVAAALRSIPDKQKEEIETELRASIDDAIEARESLGRAELDAEREALVELGDPDRLAAGYTGRPGYLIGPEHYFAYRRLLGVLLVTVVPIVAVVIAVIQVISSAGVGSVVGETVGLVISLVVHIVFWTTLVFAIIEWTGADAGAEWTLDQLPLLPSGGAIKLGETIASVVALVFAISALVLSRSLSPFVADDGSPISIFDPDLWDFWFPFFIVVLAAEIVFEVVKYRVGRWTWGLASVNLALNALFAIPAIYLLASDQIFNPEFFEALGWGSAPGESSTVVTVSIVVIALVTIWDTIDGFRKARR